MEGVGRQWRLMVYTVNARIIARGAYIIFFLRREEGANSKGGGGGASLKGDDYFVYQFLASKWH